jgi:(S)-citramalyl-CoA lyase
VKARLRRTTLFVGGLVLADLDAALAAGADLVCIDLEDAVPPGRKDEARNAVVERLAKARVPESVQLIVRINTLASEDGGRDLEAMLRIPAVGALLIPKAETAGEIRRADEAATSARSGAALYAIIESAPGLEHCAAIACAHPRLQALFFGGFDMSTALGCAMAWEPLLYARSRVVHAGALAGIEVLDSPYPELDNEAGLREACEKAKALGMTGKAAKHASQVATIRDAFTPTDAEIARARRIIEQFRADPTRPLVYEGKLVELPAVKKLERIAAFTPA